MNSVISKPVIQGVVAYAIDKYYLGEVDNMRSIYFGAATAAGAYASFFVAPIISPITSMIPSMDSNLYDTKTLGERIAEVSSSAAMVYVLNKYVLQNDIYKNELLMRVGVIVASDFISEYIDDFLGGRNLSYFTK